MSNIRIFYPEKLSINLETNLDKSQSYYLLKVMRIKRGDTISVLIASGIVAHRGDLAAHHVVQPPLRSVVNEAVAHPEARVYPLVDLVLQVEGLFDALPLVDVPRREGLSDRPLVEAQDEDPLLADPRRRHRVEGVRAGPSRGPD